MMKNIKLLCLIVGVLTWSCRQSSEAELYNAPAFTEEGAINAIIEIPAGTNRKIEYNTANKAFETNQLDGQDRIIDFLPYPANYGFIPSTLMDKERGGDGDALDVLVLGQAQPTGTMMAIRPVATLNLIDDNEIDTKIIAVPVDTNLQIMKVENFEDFLLRYNGAMRVIETWFTNYKGLGRTRLKSWENEHHALMEIKKWSTEEKKGKPVAQ